MLNSFMQILSKELELDPPLEPSAPGLYEYFLNDDLVVTLTVLQPEGYVLASNLGPYPKGKEEAFFEEMMDANLFRRDTLGASLGIDDNGNMLLTRTIDYQIEYPEFKEILEDFFATIEFWREKAQITG